MVKFIFGLLVVIAAGYFFIDSSKIPKPIKNMVPEGVITNKITSALTKEPINILFIGNSYTFYNDMPQMVANISETLDSKYVIKTEHITFGGATLEKHWKQSRTLQYITKKKWDYIVIQGQSTSMLWSDTIKSFDIYLGKFVNEINKTNAKIILFSTWPRQRGHELYKTTNLNYFKALDKIQKRYFEFAEKYNTGIFYTGTPFYKANLAGIKTYSYDGSHPNMNGSYIAALALTKYLFPQKLIRCEKIIKTINIKEKTCDQINTIF